MYKQTDKLSVSLPLVAPQLQAFDAASAVWKVVRWPLSVEPAKVKKAAMVPVEKLVNRSLDKPKEVENSFESRTAALRMSERSVRGEFEKCRSEKGHWGVWKVQPEEGEGFFQSVLPFPKPKVEAEAKPKVEKPKAVQPEAEATK